VTDASKNGAAPVTYSVDEGRNVRCSGKRRRSSRNQKSAQSNLRFAVTDGRAACGVIDLVGGIYVATGVDGVLIGKFPTLREATRSLPGDAL
jgi:hypothetical protein